MFTRYAAASPTIWWNQAQVLDTCARFEAAHATAPRPFRAQRLQVLQWPELAVEFTRLPGLDHGAVMAPALIDALALSQNPA